MEPRHLLAQHLGFLARALEPDPLRVRLEALLAAAPANVVLVQGRPAHLGRAVFLQPAADFAAELLEIAHDSPYSVPACWQRSSSVPRLQAAHLDLVSARANLSEIMRCLHPEPGIGSAANRLFETHRHFWRDCALAADDVVKLLPGGSEALRCVCDGQSQILDVLLHQTARMRRILHGHVGLLMVIQQIDLEYVPVLETEDDAPVRPHLHRPETLQVAGQWVQPETMHVDILDLLGDVQRTEDVLYLLDVLRVHASSVAAFKA